MDSESWKNAIFPIFNRNSGGNGYKMWIEQTFCKKMWCKNDFYTTFLKFKGPQFIIVDKSSAWKQYAFF